MTFQNSADCNGWTIRSAASINTIRARCKGDL